MMMKPSKSALPIFLPTPLSGMMRWLTTLLHLTFTVKALN
jgi:hypothetical protein